ncbi:MAG: Flp family type IVb pilin [Chloroflexota bacterium]|jgi:pilus assembly protein Flp/PilA
MTFLNDRLLRLLALRSEKGATMVEYGLMVALIAVVALAAVTTLGQNVASKFNQIAGAIG